MLGQKEKLGKKKFPRKEKYSGEVKMTQLKYLEDLHEHPACHEMLTLENLMRQSKSTRRYWTGIDAFVRERYGCTLTAYFLYEHHFKEKALWEIAEDIGRSKQCLHPLLKRLKIPIRNQVEAQNTLRYRKENSLRLNGRKHNEGSKRKMSQTKLRCRTLDDNALVREYAGGMNTLVLAERHGVAQGTILYRLRRKNAQLRKPGFLPGILHPRYNQTYEEHYGVERALKIKDRMSKSQKARWENI